MNVFVGVFLSVFKRSVACPGRGFFSTSVVSRSLVHREVVVVRNILGFSRSHPNISKFALGALSVVSVATLVFLYMSSSV